ncbi:MAG: GNAT family N-acetyltransferase [Desulfobacteraceae bacterium]|nr:GNAT family N-acetyltransferase [Desulfobacteraceae bacterium]
MEKESKVKIKIEPFSSSHGKGIIDLIVNIQQKEFHLPITAKDQPDLMDIKGFYQKGQGNFWAALDQDQVVGTIALLDIGNDQAALRKMFVNINYRGKEKNIANQLLKTLFQWAQSKGITEIYLGTTPKFLAAHRFYEKNRFDEITEQDLPQTFPVMKVDTKFYKYFLD